MTAVMRGDRAWERVYADARLLRRRLRVVLATQATGNIPGATSQKAPRGKNEEAQ